MYRCNICFSLSSIQNKMYILEWVIKTWDFQIINFLFIFLLKILPAPFVKKIHGIPQWQIKKIWNFESIWLNNFSYAIKKKLAKVWLKFLCICCPNKRLKNNKHKYFLKKIQKFKNVKKMFNILHKSRKYKIKCKIIWGINMKINH